MPLTPSSITEEIEKFIQEKLGILEKPMFVDVKPNPDSKSYSCVTNVQNHININLGEMVLGWHVSVWDHILIEAHFHAIWKSPSGDYVDVTSYEDAVIPVEKVLFVPDNRLPPHERRMPILRGLSNDQFVHKYISALQAYYEYDITNTVTTIHNGRASHNFVTDDPNKLRMLQNNLGFLQNKVYLAKAALEEHERQIVKRAENQLRRKARKTQGNAA